MTPSSAHNPTIGDPTTPGEFVTLGDIRAKVYAVERLRPVFQALLKEVGRATAITNERLQKAMKEAVERGELPAGLSAREFSPAAAYLRQSHTLENASANLASAIQALSMKHAMACVEQLKELSQVELANAHRDIARLETALASAEQRRQEQFDLAQQERDNAQAAQADCARFKAAATELQGQLTHAMQRMADAEHQHELRLAEMRREREQLERMLAERTAEVERVRTEERMRAENESGRLLAEIDQLRQEAKAERAESLRARTEWAKEREDLRKAQEVRAEQQRAAETELAEYKGRHTALAQAHSNLESRWREREAELVKRAEFAEAQAREAAIALGVAEARANTVVKERDQLATQVRELQEELKKPSHRRAPSQSAAE